MLDWVSLYYDYFEVWKMPPFQWATKIGLDLFQAEIKGYVANNLACDNHYAGDNMGLSWCPGIKESCHW